MDTENKIKLLQLKKHSRNYGVLSHFEGPIITKGTNRANNLSGSIQARFKKDAEKFSWASPPRARIAISLKIFCSEQNPPEIYNVAKYYLDLLKGTVFKDDKQIHYLETSIWRTPGNKSKSSVYIQVRKLIDLFKIWEIYQELDEDFDVLDKDTLFPHQYLIDQDLWETSEAQYNVLINSRISRYDRPGLRKHVRPTMMKRLSGIDPLSFDMGHLPIKGESKSFQNNINELISTFGMKYSLFRKIHVPIELDIQITKASHQQFTDLDNVATKICKEFRKSILNEKVYINGYRIYVVEEIEKDIKAGIRLKLLPAGGIEFYNERMESALSLLEEQLTGWGSHLLF
jgi:Holliday junction resolvase RusA-like endonuclease